jgi:hypothetical protein
MSQQRSLIGNARTVLGVNAALWSAVLPFAAFVAAALQLGLSGVDPDYWWHISTGRWMLEHGRIPTTDPFSATHGGQNWFAHEWLAELLMRVIDRIAGYAGEIIVTAAIVAAGAWLLGRAARYYGSTALGALVLVAGAAFFILGNLAVRPQVWGWSLFAVLLEELAAYETGRRRRLWLLPLLFAFWINIHLSALVGGGALAVYVAHRALRWALAQSAIRACEWERLKHVFTTAALCAAALFVNPRGPALIWFTRVYANPSAVRYRYIGEWQQPSFSGDDRFLFAGAAAIVLLTVAGMIWRRSLWPGQLPLLFAAASLRAIRYVPLFAIGSIPTVGWLLGGVIRDRSGLVSRRVPVLLPLVLVLASVGGILLGAYARGPSQFRHMPDARQGAYPVDATAWVKANVPSGTVFGEYGWGGYLIYQFYPQRRVYMDGREEMYGERFFGQFVDTIGAAAGWQATLATANVTATVISPNGPLAAGLDSDPGWRKAYADEIAVVYVPAGTGGPVGAGGQ